MMTETTMLMERAAKLPIEERVRLAEYLLADVPTDQEDAAFIAELNRRVDDIKRGTAKLTPAEQVFAELGVRFQ